MSKIRSSLNVANATSESGVVCDLARAGIERAIARRSRYRYVHPRVESEGDGWKIVSPNCSRRIDKQGGEIDVAWLTPDNEGGWLLFSRDHVRQRWELRARSRRLTDIFDHLVIDREREFWK